MEAVLNEPLILLHEKQISNMKDLLPVVEEGGFIPTVDHRVPADVPYENYRFYLRLKREMFRAGALEPEYDESKVG